MPDVFISYVEEDRVLALGLSDGLEAAGFTTWCYERHSVPGPSYLMQTGQAIEDCRAFLVLLSRDSLGSSQIDKEVVRAHETNKPFIPVLHGITHAEFQARRPEWRQAIGGATAILIPAEGVAAILPRIVRGLQMLRIAPARPSVPETPAPPPPIEDRSVPAPVRTDEALPVDSLPKRLPRRRTARNVGLAVAAGFVLVLAAFGPVQVVRGDDGAGMVLVPAGQFWMGNTQAEVERLKMECKKLGATDDQCKDWFEREQPRHQVYVDAFHVDRYEVTNALFERFVRATGHRTTAEREGNSRAYQQKDGKWQFVTVDGAAWRAPAGPGSSNTPDHPVVHVSWHDADAYCKWAGKRLPTEAEWEKAARGTDRRRYPWGEVWDASKANGEMTVKAAKPVGSYPAGASPYDVHDMAGNVWEWVADWFDRAYYERSPERNPKGPDSGTRRVLRGGSWNNFPVGLRSANRNYDSPGGRANYVGFRCARGASP